jgi:hypothetical protein
MGERLVRTVLVVVLILGFAVASGAPVGVVTAHPVERSHTDSQGEISVTIDCNTSRVNVSAAPMETYTLQTTKIVVTPPLTQTINDVRTAQGNTTTVVDDADVVFAFVTTRDGTVTRAFANCQDANRTTPTTPTPTRTPTSPFPPFF